MDYGAVIKGSLTGWYKDRQTLIYMLFYVLAGLLFTGVLFGVAVLLFSDSLSIIASMADPNFAADSASAFTSLFESILRNLILFITIVIPLFLLYSFVLSFLQVKMLARALQVSGFNTAEVDIGKFLRVILLSVWVLIANIISWYNKKFLIVFIGLILFFIFSAVVALFNQLAGGLLLVLWLLALLLYFFVIIYNSIRLSFSIVIFLQSSKGILECVRDSWNFTDKKVLDIFLAEIIFFVVIILVTIPFSLVSFVLQVVLQLLTNNALIAPLADTFFSVLYAPLFAAFGIYFIASLYAEIVKDKLSSL